MAFKVSKTSHNSRTKQIHKLQSKKTWLEAYRNSHFHFIYRWAAVVLYIDRQTHTHTHTLPYTSLAHAHPRHNYMYLHCIQLQQKLTMPINFIYCGILSMHACMVLFSMLTNSSDKKWKKKNLTDLAQKFNLRSMEKEAYVAAVS